MQALASSLFRDLVASVLVSGRARSLVQSWSGGCGEGECWDSVRGKASGSIGVRLGQLFIHGEREDGDNIGVMDTVRVMDGQGSGYGYSQV